MLKQISKFVAIVILVGVISAVAGVPLLSLMGLWLSLRLIYVAIVMMRPVVKELANIVGQFLVKQSA